MGSSGVWDKNTFEVKVKMCEARMNFQRSKRDPVVKQQREQVSVMMRQGQNESARIKVESVIRDMHVLEAYNILQLYLQLINARSTLISQTKEVPRDLIEAVASTIFAAKRLAEIPELSEVASLFASKYGREFAREAAADAPTCLKWSVNPNLVRCLLFEPPEGEEKLKALSEIAQDYKVKNWDAAGAASALLGDGPASSAALPPMAPSSKAAMARTPSGAGMMVSAMPPAQPELSNSSMPPPVTSGKQAPPSVAMSNGAMGRTNSGAVMVSSMPPAQPELSNSSMPPPHSLPTSSRLEPQAAPPVSGLTNGPIAPPPKSTAGSSVPPPSICIYPSVRQPITDNKAPQAEPGLTTSSSGPAPPATPALAPSAASPTSAEADLPPAEEPLLPDAYALPAVEEYNDPKAAADAAAATFAQAQALSERAVALAKERGGYVPKENLPPPPGWMTLYIPHDPAQAQQQGSAASPQQAPDRQGSAELPMPPPPQPSQSSPSPPSKKVAPPSGYVVRSKEEIQSLSKMYIQSTNTAGAPSASGLMPHQRQPPPTNSAVARNPHIFPRPPMPPPEMPHQRQPPPTDSAVARNPHIFPRPMPPPEMPHQRQPPPTNSAVARNPHIFPRPPMPPPEMPHQHQPPPTQSAVARNPHVFLDRSNPPAISTSPYVAASPPATSPLVPPKKEKKKDPCKVQ